MNPKNELFPNALEAFFLVMALYAAEFVIGGAAYDMRAYLGLPLNDFVPIVMVLGSGIVFTFIMHHKSLTYGALFHDSPASIGAMTMVLLPAIVLTIPALILVVTVPVKFAVWMIPPSAAEEAMFEQMNTGTLAILMYGCILAPVLEEMLFRGIILRSFLRQYSKWAAILGSAVLFGIAHMNLYQFIVGMLLGAYLGWLYERTRSLVPCIGLHVVYNTTLTWLDSSAGAGSEDTAGFWLMALVMGATGAYGLKCALIGPAVGHR